MTLDFDENKKAPPVSARGFDFNAKLYLILWNTQNNENAPIFIPDEHHNPAGFGGLLNFLIELLNVCH